MDSVLNNYATALFEEIKELYDKYGTNIGCYAIYKINEGYYSIIDQNNKNDGVLFSIIKEKERLEFKSFKNKFSIAHALYFVGFEKWKGCVISPKHVNFPVVFKLHLNGVQQ